MTGVRAGSNGTGLREGSQGTGVTSGPPFPTPAGLTVIAEDDDKIFVSWDAVDDATGYAVQVSIDGGSWNAVAGSPFVGTSFEETGLDEGTEYCYRVRAIGPESMSPWSAPVCAETLPNPPIIYDVTTSGPASPRTLSYPDGIQPGESLWVLQWGFSLPTYVGFTDVFTQTSYGSGYVMTISHLPSAVGDETGPVPIASGTTASSGAVCIRTSPAQLGAAVDARRANVNLASSPALELQRAPSTVMYFAHGYNTLTFTSFDVATELLKQNSLSDGYGTLIAWEEDPDGGAAPIRTMQFGPSSNSLRGICTFELVIPPEIDFDVDDEVPYDVLAVDDTAVVELLDVIDVDATENIDYTVLDVDDEPQVDVFSPALSAAILALTPTGFWKLNDASGQMQDSSGNARHSTTAGGVTYRAVQGPISDRFVQMISSAVVIPDADAWTPGSSGITLFWLSRPITLDDKRFWGKGVAPNQRNEFAVRLNPTGQLISELMIANGGILRRATAPTAAVGLNAWQAFCVTMDGNTDAATIEQYKNSNTPLGKTDFSGATGTVPNDTADLWLASSYSLNNSVAGGHAFFAIFTGVLTEEQIGSLMEAAQVDGWIAPIPVDESEAVVDVDGSTVTIEWPPVPGAVWYEVEVSTGGGTYVPAPGGPIWWGPIFSSAEVPPGSYAYRIRSVNAGGKSEWSAPIPVEVGGGSGFKVGSWDMPEDWRWLGITPGGKVITAEWGDPVTVSFTQLLPDDDPITEVTFSIGAGPSDGLLLAATEQVAFIQRWDTDNDYASMLSAYDADGIVLSEIDMDAATGFYAVIKSVAFGLHAGLAYLWVVDSNLAEDGGVLFVVDVSDPADMSIIGSLTTVPLADGDLSRMHVMDGHIYIACGADSNDDGILLLIDVSDPTAPFVAATENVTISLNDNSYVMIDGPGWAVVRCEDVGSSIASIDLSDPESPVVVDVIKESSIFNFLNLLDRPFGGMSTSGVVYANGQRRPYKYQTFVDVIPIPAELYDEGIEDYLVGMCYLNISDRESLSASFEHEGVTQVLNGAYINGQTVWFDYYGPLRVADGFPGFPE